MERTATWNNVGVDVKGAKAIKEVLKIANLDYIVEKEPVYFKSGEVVPNRFVTVKQGTEEAFGIVKSNYEVIQNEEAFSFADYLVPEGLEFLKAGETKANKLVYIIGVLPSINLLGDEITPHLIIQNSHCGSSLLKATICPLRIVCQNQFNLSFNGSDNNMRIRHTASAKHKIQIASEIMVQNSTYLEKFKKEAFKLAMSKVSKSQEENIINSVFVINEELTNRQMEKILIAREAFKAAYNSNDNQNFKGTKWGLINAYTDYLTHKPFKDTKNGVENNFLRVTFSEDLNKFVNIIKRVEA